MSLVFPEEGEEASIAGVEEALSLLDRRDRLEQTVLVSLKANRKDYQNAFASISKNTRFIYIHAYQSYLWNRAVSERLRMFGRKVLLGDLVAGKGANLDDELAENEDEEKPQDEKDKEEKKTSDDELIEVTEENIMKYTLGDVVMPMIGHAVALPKNEKLRAIF